MHKRYKLEFGLGLGGAIAGISAFIYTLMNTFIFFVEHLIVTIPVIIGLFFMLTAFIIAFVGAAKLNRNQKSGGVFLLVSAALTITSAVLSFSTAWYGLLFFPLTLVAGLLALLKKVSTPMDNNPTYVNTFDGLQ